MKIVPIVTLFLLVTPMAGFAVGGGGFSYAQTQFWLADKDHNQFLDRKEARSVHARGLSLASVFDQVDADGDGRISKSESAAFIAGRGSYEPKSH